MPNLKPMEILLILLVVLLLLGAKRLPDLAQSVGKSLKILKTEVKDPDANGRLAETAASSPSAVINPVTAAQATDAWPVKSTLSADGYDGTDH